MAKASNALHGWQLILKDPDTKAGSGNPSRRSRRGNSSLQSITLRRESDELEIKAGDCILVQQGDSSEIAFIKEIRFGNDNFLDIIVAWFLRSKDVEGTNKNFIQENPRISNEILITPYLEEIKITEIVDKVQVLSYNDFKQIIIDDSSVNNTFMTRRGCDSSGEYLTEIFDWKDLMELYKKDPNDLWEWLRLQTIPTAYKATTAGGSKKTSSVKQVLKESKPPQKRKLVLSENDDNENNDDDDDNSNSIHNVGMIDDASDEALDGGDEELFDSDHEELNKEPVKKPTPSKRRYTRKLTSPSKSPTKSTSDISKQFMNSVLSPTKKGRQAYKVKTEFKPSLSLLSPKKPKIRNSKLDITSKAFTEIKAKLHTSTRLSSLPGREDQFLTIYAALEDTIKDQIGTCLYVSGTPGVGKTATIREVISQLQDSVKEGQLNEFDYLEINGLKLISPNAAYEKLWGKISGFKVTAANAAILLENYFKDPTQKKKPLIVLMDELDQIVTKKQNVMYNFFNWPTYEHSKLIVIAVANTMDLPERVLTNKISSRLGLNRIQFIGYSFDQLETIIKHRLDMLTKTHQRKVVIKEDAIGFASRKVASVSGDARRALTICRRAVEIAEKDYLDKLKENNKKEDEQTFHVQIIHISQAINETINSPLQKFLKSLPFSSKLLLAATLLRNKRSGLAENSLGDIIDEMKSSLQMLTSKESNSVFRDMQLNSDLMQMLYGSGLLEDSSDTFNLRISKFKHVLTELVEYGILVQQSIPSERYKLTQLNVSAEEVSSALSQDPEVGDLLRTINA